MQWKSPWRRRSGGLVDQPPVNMWFFNLAGDDDGANYWRYLAGAVSPSFADAPLPFWFGMVFYGAAAGPVAQMEAGSGFGDGAILRATNLLTDTLANADTENQVLQLVVQQSISVPPLLPTYDTFNNFTVPGTGVLTFNWLTVTVVLVRVTPVVGGFNVEPWVDNIVQPSETVLNPYVPPATALFLGGATGAAGAGVGPSLHGVVGGAGAPTDAEVHTWFETVRNGAEIVEIPGLTTDLWSAAAAAPLAPALLPNLAGGQALTLTAVGAPGVAATNTQVAVSFNY